MRQRIQPVVLAGGEGARLAPISTPEVPKPFVLLPDGGSLMQQTLARLSAAYFMDPVLIGRIPHRALLLSHAARAGVPLRAMLLEPAPRNTAMAVAVAAAWALERGEGERVLAILPADHAIADPQAWCDAIWAAARTAATQEAIVLIGVTPPQASSGLGYMHIHEERVIAFREKPEDAAHLLRQGWKANSGQCIARAAVLATLLDTHAPHIWQAAQQAVAGAIAQEGILELAAVAYDAILPIAFDRAVLEHTQALLAVECECGWQDIGAPQAFLAYARHMLDEAAMHYPRSEQPWGYAERIAQDEHSLSKCLTLLPGHRLSLQRHAARIEVWLLLEGEAEAELDGLAYPLVRGQSITIPQGVWHRLANTGTGPLRLMELQVGRPDENDIERREDDYGRT